MYMGPKSKASKANFFQNQSNPQENTCWYIPKSEPPQELETAYGPSGRFLFLPDTNEYDSSHDLIFRGFVSSKKLEIVFRDGFYNTAMREDDDFPSLQRILGEGIVRLNIDKYGAISDADDVGFVFVIDAKKENNLTCVPISSVNMSSADPTINKDFRQEYADCHGGSVSDNEEGSDIWMFFGARQIDPKRIVGAYITESLAHTIGINTYTTLIVNPNYKGNLDEVKHQLKLDKDKLVHRIPSFQFDETQIKEIQRSVNDDQPTSTSNEYTMLRRG